MNARRLGLAFAGVCVVAALPAFLQAQTPLGGEFQVNTYTTGNQTPTRSAVAVAPNGSFVVVWNSPGDGSGAGIFGQRYDSKGAPIGGEFQVNSYTTNQQFGAAIAMAPNGSFVVAWTGYGDGGTGSYYTYNAMSYPLGQYGVWARRFTANGTPIGNDFQVNSYTTYYQTQASVALDPSGDFVVAWRSGYYYDVNGQDGSSGGIFARRFAADGTPAGSEFQVNTFTTGYQYGASLASASSGDFVVVWTNYVGQDGSYAGVFGQRFNKSGAADGGEFQVNTYTTGSQGQPKVSTRTNGDFVVVWRGFSQDGSSAGIFGQRYDASGAPTGAEFQVNTYTTNNQSVPAVAVDRNGDFVVAWRSLTQDGDDFGVFGRRFLADGTPAGGEFQANTYTTARQQNASVAARPNGDFIVVWQSRTAPPSTVAQDGSASGVFARRYRR